MRQEPVVEIMTSMGSTFLQRDLITNTTQLFTIVIIIIIIYDEMWKGRSHFHKREPLFYVLRKIPTQNSVSKENLKDQEKKQSRCREDEAIWLYCTYYYYCRYNIINSYNRTKKKQNVDSKSKWDFHFKVKEINISKMGFT